MLFPIQLLMVYRKSTSFVCLLLCPLAVWLVLMSSWTSLMILVTLILMSFPDSCVTLFSPGFSLVLPWRVVGFLQIYGDFWLSDLICKWVSGWWFFRCGLWTVGVPGTLSGGPQSKKLIGMQRLFFLSWVFGTIFQSLHNVWYHNRLKSEAGVKIQLSIKLDIGEIFKNIK